MDSMIPGVQLQEITELVLATHATMDSMIPGVQLQEITELVLATHATMDSMILMAHHQKTKVSVPVSTD
jgi:hypothetical protein